MHVFYGLNNLPQFKNPVVTIGTFDGVHNGHKKILAQLTQEAKVINGETVVITFHPHPRNIVGDTISVKLLTTLPEKLLLLQQQQINNVVVVAFDDDLSCMQADAYVQDFLYKNFKPHTLIIGYDHRFGKQRQGNYQLLEQYGHKLGFWVKEIKPELLQEASISSTRTRKSLLQSAAKEANSLLGHNYFFEGVVIKGDQLGRTIGYPTANLQIQHEDKLVPGDGVYAVRCVVQAENAFLHTAPPYPLFGMMYIGSRPVVNGKRRVIEVNIFDFNEDIYDDILKVELVEYIRGEMPLNGLEALKNQLSIDKENCIAAITNPL